MKRISIADRLILVVFLLTVLLAAAFAFSGCKSVQKSLSKEKSSVDSTAKSAVVVAESDERKIASVETKQDSSLIATEKTFDKEVTTTTTYDSVGRKKSQIRQEKIRGVSKKVEQKAVKEAAAISLESHSNYDSAATNEVILKAEKESKVKAVEKSKFSFPWLWLLLVVGLCYGGYRYAKWKGWV